MHQRGWRPSPGGDSSCGDMVAIGHALEQHAGQKFTARQFISAYLSLLTRLRGPDQSKTAPLARFGAYEVMATARSHIGGNSEPRCGSSMLATG